MTVIVNGNEYELNTKLRTAMKIEEAFKLPLPRIFENLDSAEITELVKMVTISAGKTEPEFKSQLLESWDYTDLFDTVNRIIANLMFSGTPEQNELKISKMPTTEERKNGIRALLEMPANVSPALNGSE